MTDRGTSRPHLPDPQHDRHVAFPETAGEAGVAGGSDAARATGSVAPAVGSLPPEAWAPRAPETLHHGQPVAGPQPPRDPWILSTPPRRAPNRPFDHRSNRRGAGWLVGLVVVAMFFGLTSNGSGGMSADDGGMGIEMGAGPMDGDPGNGAVVADSGDVVVEPDEGTTTIPGILPASTTVHPLPPGTTRLRLEVAARPGSTGDFELVGEHGVIEHTVDEPLPLARRLSHPADRMSSMTVNAMVTSGDPTIQCRLYAGDLLVALQTSTTSVTCELLW